MVGSRQANCGLRRRVRVIFHYVFQLPVKLWDALYSLRNQFVLPYIFIQANYVKRIKRAIKLNYSIHLIFKKSIDIN